MGSLRCRQNDDMNSAKIQSDYYDKTSDLYRVPCLAGKKTSAAATPVTVCVPGSKSITNRALLLATLADGTSTLTGTLFSEDSRHFLSCIQALGFHTTVDEANRVITVEGHNGSIPNREASLYVGSAGTAARFLTAYLGISHGNYHLDASAQMRKRPMAPLLTSLRELGCEIICGETENAFPFQLKSNGFSKNEIRINIDSSSQFLSALLISSALAPKSFRIDVEGTHGMAYIDMTRNMMQQFGVTVHTDRSEKAYPDPVSHSFITPAGQHYTAREYRIEPDVSAACYFYACAPLLHLPVQVKHVHFDSLQGDVAFLRILERMGCTLEEADTGVIIYPPIGKLHGITADMSACSDQAITLAAIAPFADAPTTITGIGHIRLQESDRMQAIVNELTRMGIRCEMTHSANSSAASAADSLTIYPGTPAPCTVKTYEDHRMAMGFSLIGLLVPGIAIQDPGCCAKTFENYFEVLEETIVKKFQM